uniref:Uncharacterized protein n=1 Tax=Vespula pensylvanica TaxID=30213 RepID=A0A834K261_VESPE|nr:hypothetical protein H0235_016721 [Vespula pensylvanica]
MRIVWEGIIPLYQMRFGPKEALKILKNIAVYCQEFPETWCKILWKNQTITAIKPILEYDYLFPHQSSSPNFFCSDDNTFVKLFSLTISIRFNVSGFAEPKCLKHENNHVTKDCKKYRNQLELIIMANSLAMQQSAKRIKGD